MMSGFLYGLGLGSAGVSWNAGHNVFVVNAAALR